MLIPPHLKLLAGAFALAAAFAAGGYAHMVYRDGVDAESRLEQLDDASRETKRQATENKEITDELISAQLGAAGFAAAMRDRLRERAQAASQPAGCPGRSDDPRVPVELLSDGTREDFERFATECQAVNNRLAALQAREQRLRTCVLESPPVD